MSFLKSILSIIYDTLRGLYYIVLFILDLIVYVSDIFNSLPSEISGIIIALFITSVGIIVYKAIKV